jgi:dolichol-phosphate mannosyltransferase
MSKVKNKISIIIPVYNEEKTIGKVVDKIISVKFPITKEIIIVNDGSKDNTEKKLKQIRKNEKIKFISYEKNKGKGFAIRKGLEIASGNIIGIQDADLEYDIKEYPKLLAPIIKKEVNVVYGSRFNKKFKKNLFYFGNKFLSFITSVLYFHKISDMETCYKLFRKDILENIELESDRFDFEPEITAKILKQGFKIKEIPINYFPRTEKQGKKIKIKDGFSALWCLIKCRFAD